MRRFLDLLAVPATRAPRVTLATLAVLTLMFAGLATQLVVSSDLSDFAPEGGLNASLVDVEERFGAGDSVQLIVDTGAGGDLLTPDGLAAGARLAEALRDDAELAPLLAADGLDRPAVLTYAEPFEVAAELMGTPLEELDAASAASLVAALLEEDAVGDQAAALLSDDLQLDPPRARGGIGLVELAPGLDPEQQLLATERVERVAADVQSPGVRVSVISDVVIEQAIEEGIERDIPVLLSLSLALVVGVLGWLFRSVSDVIVGLTGLVASIVWMTGLAALLGPGMLDLVGPFGQTAIAVPVLLVGLGVDYSVHLTTRYREQQDRGDTPTQAATTAVHTVGVALVLATAATVGGFLANLATPLPPIADLGIFAALGIVAAFVLFGLTVPATRVLLDHRRRTGKPSASPTAEPSRWTDVLTHNAVARPGAVLTVTALLLALGGISAAGLGTEFDERSFLPDGAPVTASLDRTDLLFGGDVGEQTYVLIDGPTDDAAFLAAAARLEDRLVELDGVRRLGDRPQVTSPFELLDRLGERGQRVRDELASDLAAWADPDAASADLPIPERLAPETIEANVDDGADLDVPPEVLEAVARRLPTGRPPAVALATSGDPAVVRAAVRGQFRDRILSDRPDGLSDAAVTRLAALPADDLDVATLEDAGFPLPALPEADLVALDQLERLEAAGWDRDGPSRQPDAVAAQLTVAADEVPDEYAEVADDRGLLLMVSTSAGQDGAGGLAADIGRLGEDVEAAGGDVTTVSRPLVNEEIIDSLSSAQLLAIVISLAIATALLVVASVVSQRSVALGLIGIAPAAAALVLVLGSMRVIGLSFNALTATVASIAIGIGVPYGIHLTNRFRVSMTTEPTVEAAVADTMRHTGGALAGSAVTTGLAFGVLGLSSSVPLRQFGVVSAMMITFALLACLVLQPTLLALWARRRPEHAV